MRDARKLSLLTEKLLSRITHHAHSTFSLPVVLIKRTGMSKPFRLIFWLVIIFGLTVTAWAQIQIGTVKVIVTDSSDAVLPNVRIVLTNPVSGYQTPSSTDEHGIATLNNVPLARYILRVETSGFQVSQQNVAVRSNIPVTVYVTLVPVGASESVTIGAGRDLVERGALTTESAISSSRIERVPSITGSRDLQRLIATTPGWMTENNGLLHIRGVDDGILYVIDGIPTVDRLDAVSASVFDTEMIQSLKIITGNIPAEFGGRSGAVVIIQPKSGINTPIAGGVSLGGGTFHAGEIAYSLGGSINRKLGFFINNSASRSDRFLDPVDFRNFNNRGGTFKLNLRADWHPLTNDTLLFNLSVNGTNFRVPNDLEQELAGQRERQQLRDNSQSISWQHVWSAATVGDFACFHRFYRSRLTGSQFDIPIFANQDREHTRQGVIASLSHFSHGHILKAGFEATRTSVREFFTFAITDRDAAEEREVSEPVRAFDPANPFIFQDRRIGGYLSGYVQDSFSAFRNFTINAGLRYEHSSLPVADYQFSPRIGAAYYIERIKTAIRASFNRLYMPPQIENLLLSNSEAARRLSPFATPQAEGGAVIRPEKVSAWEVGFSQDILGIFRLDMAYWWRSFRNFDDPNAFFNTTIIFPNSVARGKARGVDARVDVPERKGWSGYFSYTNARILQTGPINGGLFLTDDFVEIGPGTDFIPDHDQRNVGAFGITYYNHATGLWASFSGRYESGVPLEVEPERLEELSNLPGSDLVDFTRSRVKPWKAFDLAAGIDLFRDERVTVGSQFVIENIANEKFVYNFGSPFEGTHFGHPRLWGGRLKLTFH